MLDSIRAYVWRAGAEDLKLANNVLSIVSKALGIDPIPIDDTYSVVPIQSKRVIAFGHQACTDADHLAKVYELPDLSKLSRTAENATHRQNAFNILQQVIDDIRNEIVPAEKHVKLPSGHTVGMINSDFCITEQEATYLKQIKDLLGGSKMVITKGDIRIEVE